MAKDFDCGCNAGRTYLIDPNKSSGNGFGNNSTGNDGTFVPPEDLNIYVELTTIAKSRSVISVDSSSKLTTENISKGKNKISFIDGKEDKSGEKSLTTSYTELTTVFNKNADTEHLGISSIDVNFNSSYAPLINIKFIDVRGSGVFAHGNDSPYSVFFELPYPIFELKIKGYYGKPVKYCLHLTKWNSKFNSTTGNFEISADFIGYTYAMLTDMLLGYIRAITKTPRGEAKFAEMKEEMAKGGNQENVDSFITISDLLDRIELVNFELSKLKSDDSDILELANSKDVINALDNIEELLADRMVAIKKEEKSEVMDTGDGLFAIRQPSGTNQADLFIAYQNEIKTKIEKVNEELTGKIKLNVEDYTTKVKQYTNITLSGITSNTAETNKILSDGYSAADYDIFRAELEGKLKGQVNGADVLSIYDFRSAIKAIAVSKNKVDESETKVKEAVGKKAEELVNKTLGFSPTIRNIFSIFTTHVEIFLECLKDVSSEADLDANGARAGELAKLDKSSYDVHQDVPKIYPWPLYRKQKDKKSGFEEAYLGSEPVIIDNKVPELKFVDDLLKGLIRVNTEENERLNAALVSDGESWFAINPLDTAIFTTGESSWSQLETANNGAANKDDIFRMMFIRAFSFFHLNAQTFDEGTIMEMGASEGAAAHNFLLNTDIKDVVANLPGDDIDSQVAEIIKRFTGKIDSKSTEPTVFMKEQAGQYVYNWITETQTTDFGSGPIETPIAILPFNGDYDRYPFYSGTTNNFDFTPENVWEDDNKDGTLFIQNEITGVNIENSEVKGGVFLKIMELNEYTSGEDTGLPDFRTTDSYDVNEVIPNTTSGPDVPLAGLYDSTPNVTSISGFNVFKGKYKTQELFQFNIDASCTAGRECSPFVAADGGEGGPFSSVPIFFKDGLVKNFYTDIGVQQVVFCTSLAEGYYNPNGQGAVADTNSSIVAGTKESQYGVDLPVGEVNGGFGRRTRLSGKLTPDHGQDRSLWEKAFQNNSDVWVPDAQFACEMEGNDSYEVNPWSLFGSQLYFEQRRSNNPAAARAFLFLHTLPWNGLTDGGSNRITGDNYKTAEGMFNRTDNYFTMQNIFGRRPAFINAPKTWCAFIGGLLWRYDGDPIVRQTGQEHTGGAGPWDPIIWGRSFETTPDGIPRNGAGQALANYPTLGNGNSRQYNSADGLYRGRVWDNDDCWDNDFNDYHYYDYYFESFAPKPDKERSDSASAFLYQEYPRRNEFLTSTEGCAPFQISEPATNTDARTYKALSTVLTELPIQVKEEFKKAFFEFVNGDFLTISSKMEIFPQSMENLNNGNPISSAYFDSVQGRVTPSQFSDGTDKWKALWNSITTADDNSDWSDTILNQFNIDNLRNNYNKISRGRWYTESGDHVGKRVSTDAMYVVSYNYLTVFKKQSDIQNIFRKLFTESVVIANNNPKIWNPKSTIYEVGGLPSISKKDMTTYVKRFLEVFKEYNGTDDIIKDKIEDQAKQEIFNTMDDDTIRLNIYRHCKAIYDKWIGGSGTDIMFTCGSRPKRDESIARSSGRDKPKLIDSFRFVNRAFNDLGDDFLLNPAAISSILTKNYNQSFYDLISRILADNNFNFIPLPTYIDYDGNTMCEMFDANIISQDISNDISGPSFVCVYVGQTSNKLDLGKNSDYPNDGFDLFCDDNNNLRGAPEDFTTKENKEEHNIPVFMVNYGHENQNIFKDVKLDQSEFAETDESLVITDNIANSASHSNRTFAGQNLWNVYQMRSYSTEVTSLGNAQIQPMMYFQLNSIPMFHGAYMIINVSHKIIPNHMTTTFKGVRVRYTDTPLIKAETLYMSLLGGLSDVDGSGNSVGTRAIPNNIGYIGNDQQPPIDVNYNHIRLRRD